MIDEADRVRFLRRVELFREAPAAVLGAVAQRLGTRTLAAGDTLFEEGEPGNDFFIIQSGTLAVTTTIAGEDHELTRLFAGEFLGEIALLGTGGRTATVRAVSEASLLTLTADDFKQLVADVPALDSVVREAAARRQSRSLRTELEVEHRNLAVLLESRDSVTIGRAADNDLVFGSLNVAEHHARLRKTGSGAVELVHIGDDAGTFVNGRRVNGSAVLSNGDEVVLGDQRFVFSGTAADAEMAVVEPRGVRIDLIDVSKTVRGGKRLLNDVSLSILPGEFVGIVGGSGAGKTTLLDAMAGLRPATEGTVLYNGRDYYNEIDQYRHVLGYVPQDDIIHGELAVRQTLRYAARLRLPRDTSKESIEAAIDQRLEELGLSARQDLVVDKLSGGQRKRSSIAIELLTEPRVFYLDEPTSGLDPATDRSMMQLLRRLADDGRTVVLTTHATKNVGLCDKIIVMARDGHLAYAGPPAEALEYFGVEAFDEIYDRLEQDDDPAEWGRRFRAAGPARPSGAAAAAPGSAASDIPEVAGRRGGLREVLRQFRVLAARNFTVHRKPQNLMPLLMQPVVISLLILSLFRSGIFHTTTDSPNTAMQMVYTFDFVMFLFGLLFGAQEMVRETAIFRRERTVGVRVAPYLLSKATFLGPLLALVGTAMTTVFWLTGRLPDRGFDVYGPLLLTVILTGWAGMAMSLLISSAVRTSQQATDLLTPWIAPQVLFAGALFAVPSMNFVGRALSNVTAVRWSFEASSHITELKKLFGLTEGATGQALLVQYDASFNWQPAAYWGILAAFVIMPLVLAGIVLDKKSRPR